MTKSWKVAFGLALALLLTSCSRGDPHDSTRPPGSPSTALTKLLAAEQRGDHDASFALVSRHASARYRDADDWARRRTELPAVTGFRIERTAHDDVVAVVEHAPGLDAFVGLSPARDRETWHARAERGAWRFDPDPEIAPILPAREAARGAALAWATAAQRCDATATARLQAVTRVFGRSVGADGLCGSHAALHATAMRLEPGPSTSDLVSQYTSDLFSWATAVRIEGADRSFGVVLAPIGDVWRVIGVFDS